MSQSIYTSTPFLAQWFSFNLGQHHSYIATYYPDLYDQLPPIPKLDGSFNWLTPLPERLDQDMKKYRNPPEQRGDIQKIITEADKRGIVLPDTFMRFMGSVELQDCIPSCTACTFGLSDEIISCTGNENGSIIRFMADQQDCLLWHLYLTAKGEELVIVAPIRLDNYSAYNEEMTEQIIKKTYICAPSFEAFLYRFWLENIIWFKLRTNLHNTPFTEEEQEYLKLLTNNQS
jgi:hypothetical protein